MMKKLFLLLAMVVTIVTTAMAHDYTFDLSQMTLPENGVQQMQIPEGGINVFIRSNINGQLNQPFNFYAWNGGTKLFGDFPGKELTDADKRMVSLGDNDGNKETFFMIHFDESDYSSGTLGFIASKWGNQTADVLITKPGNYFYDFNTGVWENGKIKITNISPNYFNRTDRTTVYVHTMNSDNTTFNDNANTYIYAWKGNDKPAGEWPGTRLTESVTVDGEKWFVWRTNLTDLSGVILSDGNGIQTMNIDNGYDGSSQRRLVNGDNFYYFKPNDSGTWRFQIENIDWYTTRVNAPNVKMWGDVLATKIQMLSPDGNFRLTFNLGVMSPYYNPYQATTADIQFVNGRLQLPAYSTITVESLTGYPLNQVVLGPMTQNAAWGQDQVRFDNPREEDEVHSYVQAGAHANLDPANYHLNNFFRDALIGQHTFTVGGENGSSLGGNSKGSYFIGPNIYVRDECISTEALTFADHNVKESTFTLSDDLVGVDVFGEYLICRSAGYISDAHKHKPNASQSILKINGATPAYADPTTPQYSWIALKGLSDPASLKGKQLRDVRGVNCSDWQGGISHRGWLNPTMTVQSYEVVAEGVETQLNTYCVANFSEQDKENTTADYTPKYFFMEPRHWEICNVVDVMRTPNQVVYAPTENALMPAGRINQYARNGIEGSASLDNFTAAWKAVDDTVGAPYLTYNHVFRIERAIAFTQDWDQTNDTRYDYPLDTPNPYYDKEITKAFEFFLWGMPDTKVMRDSSYTDDNFASADMVYFSRYDVATDRNVYKNDLRIMVNNPKTNLEQIHDMVVTRRDRLGDNPVVVATLQRVNTGNYRVVYNSGTQTAPAGHLVNSLGDQNYLHPENIYHLVNDAATDDNPNIIYLSDRFVSNSFTCESSIKDGQNNYYQYRVERAAVDTDPNITCVVSGVPVFRNYDYELTRAEYTQDEVENDVLGTLADGNNVNISFTAEAPTADYVSDNYDVMRGKQYEMASAIKGAVNLESSTFMMRVTTSDSYSAGDNFYVPTQYTEYNENTYGSYKQEVDFAEVILSQPANLAVEASTLRDANGMANDDGNYRYFHCDIDMSGTIENAAKDERYLYRVWRKVVYKNQDNGAQGAPRRAAGDNGETLLNTVANNFHYDNPTTDFSWDTDYAAIGNFTGEEMSISDTFLAEVEGNNGDEYNFDVEYRAILYVKDKESQMYYPVQSDKRVAFFSEGNVVTAVADLRTDTNRQVADVRYYNTMGMESNEPFSGVNIIVTRYTDGTTSTTKVLR